MTPTNMPYIVYRCDRIKRGMSPQNEIAVEHHLTFNEAADAANAMRRSNPSYSFTVGMN